jgi:hypothetical protein
VPEWTPSDVSRFMAKVDRINPGGHWLWTGATTAKGYGRFYKPLPFAAPYAVPAHVAALEMAGVALGPDEVPDHLCRVRNCVNPEHLEPVRTKENTRRARASRGIPVGSHEWTPIPRPGVALLLNPAAE